MPTIEYSIEVNRPIQDVYRQKFRLRRAFRISAVASALMNETLYER